jgi:hypothetical protein
MSLEEKIIQYIKLLMGGIALMVLFKIATYLYSLNEFLNSLR